MSDSGSPALAQAHREKAGETRCGLCGLPVGRSRVQLKLGQTSVQFCCPGCLYVYQILSNTPDGPPRDFKDTDLYKACLSSGLIPRSEADLLSKEEDGKNARPLQAIDGRLALSLSFRVEGMWCPACSFLIEEALRKTKGVLEVRVAFLSDLAQVTYLPHEISIETIMDRVSTLGYRPSRLEEASGSSQERRDLLFRLGISCFLTANVMMISFALYFGFFQELGKGAIQYLSYPLWALATPVIFYGGFPILKRAVIGLRYFSASMDTLISIGSLSAYLYSLLHLFKGSLHLYFDTSSMLITLVLLGRYIEVRSRDKLSSGITELYLLTKQKVRLLTEGAERWVSSEGVEPQQVFVVLGGERAPIDGCILSGAANVDESVLTGESRPIRKKENDELMAGTLILDGALTLRAVRKAGGSFLEQMIRLTQEAILQKNTYEILGERIMRWFVPLLLSLAGGTGLILLSKGVSTEAVLLRILTVLVITCPCALGIASPLAKVAAIGLARAKGILVRDPLALERVKDTDVMIFDKTGTMTEGRFSLQRIVSGAVGPEEALRRIASMETLSDHFVAREVVRAARKRSIELEQVDSFEKLDGLGVKGRVSGADVAIGNRKMMALAGLRFTRDDETEAVNSESKGMTVVFFGWAGVVQGYLVFGDTPKENARWTVLELKKEGMETWLVSGDSRQTTEAVAAELGIGRLLGEALPQDKMELIKNLQKQGHRVGMVGDGFNDAAALAQADVGIAIGSRTNLARDASDLILLSDDPGRILDLLRLSKLTSKIIRQNLLFAFLYNVLAIPFAIAGFLNPLIAVFAMFSSSLTVIGNTLRIFRKDRSGIPAQEGMR